MSKNKESNRLRIFSVLCGLILSVSTVAHASNIEYIQNQYSYEITEKQKIDILSFSAEWPSGTTANRVHYREGSLLLVEWAYKAGITPYSLLQRERRYVGLGGKPAIRVNTQEAAEAAVRTTPYAIGYIFRFTN